MEQFHSRLHPEELRNDKFHHFHNQRTDMIHKKLQRRINLVQQKMAICDISMF